MKKLLFIIIPAALMAGCSEELVITPSPEIEKEVTSEIPLRNVENAVYNELTDSWMIPQADPFTLENFQKAYDNLASGRSLQTLTRAESEELFEPEVKLEPTHYALKIYPKTEEEQTRVEIMEDVSVAYAPFNYSAITTEEVERVVQTRSEISSPFEVSPYTVTYDYTESTDGSPVGPVTLQLPVLYVVWPVEKPLPEDLEYVIDYEIFQPHKAPQTRSSEDVSTLVNEAFALASGDPAGYFGAADAYYAATEGDHPSTRAVGAILQWSVQTHDDLVGKDVPMANLKVAVNIGSLIINTSSNSSGGCQITLPNDFPYTPGNFPATMTYTYQDPQGRWKLVTSETSTIPFSITHDAWPYFPDSRLRFGQWPLTLPDSPRQENEIHRAVNYFFNGQNVFPKSVPSGGIRIVANNFGNPDAEGGFLPSSSSTSNCCIRIFNNGRPDNNVIGTTLHELGHMAHYLEVGYDKYDDTHSLLKESFASYSGWYFGEKYLTSVGWTNPDYYPNYADVTAQGRQYWYYAYTGKLAWYTPLFIDLTDRYNQSVLDSRYYPHDDVANVPASVVWDIITNSTSWNECESKLQSYVGVHYDENRLNNCILQYVVWFSLHN